MDGKTERNPKGIEDLVVGAPYDGAEHRGAVYIYLGSEDGVHKKYAQVSVPYSHLSPSGLRLSIGIEELYK